jgi:hypothetical protein
MAWHAGQAFNRLLLRSGVIVVVVSLQRVLARRQDPIGLWTSLGGGWIILALVASLVLPGISYVFLLPSVFFTLCALAMLALARRMQKAGVLALQVVPACVAFA